MIYDFDLIANCDKSFSDQRRLIVRYLYLRAAPEVLHFSFISIYYYFLFTVGK